MSINMPYSSKEEELDFANDMDKFKVPFCPLTFPDHDDFAERIRKTLYCGKLPVDERTSLPMTDLAVGFLRDAAPKELGKIDMYWAADVSRRAYISPCSMMLGMIYIERLKHKNPDYLNTVSSSDLFLISMMVASKYLYDEGIEEEVYNDEWAESADMDLEDVNTLEREFLAAIDWSLFIHKEDFEKLLGRIEERIALSQGLDRGGYWSYSDIMVLLKSAKLHGTLREVMAELCQVVLVCSVAYTAGTLTVLGSMSTLNILKSHMHLHTVNHNFNVTAIIPGAIHIPFRNNTSTIDDDPVTSQTSSQTSGIMLGNLNHIGTLGSPGNDTVLEEHSHVYQYSIENSIDHTATSANMVEHHTNNNSAATNLSTTLFLERPPSSNSGLSFPGFLTLALIKDTVTQFITGSRKPDLNGHRRYPENEDVLTIPGKSDDSSDHKPIKCKCPYCPLKLKSRRQKWRNSRGNISCLSGLIVPPYGLWNSLKFMYKCCGRANKVFSHKNANMCKSKGCGNTGQKPNNLNVVLDHGEELDQEGADRMADGDLLMFDNDINSIEISNVHNLPMFSSDHDYEKNSEVIIDSTYVKCKVKDANLLKNYIDAVPACQLETSFIDLTSGFITSVQIAVAG